MELPKTVIKIFFLSDLSILCADQSLPILIGRDFNILRFSCDKNKTLHDNKFSDAFNSIINVHALGELHMVGGAFTWSDNQENPTLKKLDRILISDGWENIFPLTMVRKCPRASSDHNSLIVDTGENIEFKGKEFRFENSWIGHLEFKQRVAHALQSVGGAKDNLSRFLLRLKKVKSSLKGRGINLRGHSIRIKKNLLEELSNLVAVEETQSLSGDMYARKSFVQGQLLHIC